MNGILTEKFTQQDDPKGQKVLMEKVLQKGVKDPRMFQNS